MSTLDSSPLRGMKLVKSGLTDDSGCSQPATRARQAGRPISTRVGAGRPAGMRGLVHASNFSKALGKLHALGQVRVGA